MFIQSQRKGRRVYKWLTQSNKCLKTVDGWRVRKTVAGRSVSLINGFAPELVDCTEKNKKEKKLLDKKQTKKTFGKERGAAEEGYPKAGSQSKRASTPHTHTHTRHFCPDDGLWTRDRGDGVLSRPGPHLVFFLAPAIFKYTYERTVQFQVCFQWVDSSSSSTTSLYKCIRF
jgi:hypothetical protein